MPIHSDELVRNFRRTRTELFRAATFLLALVLALHCSRASAHEPTKSYLNLTFTPNGCDGQWRIPESDLRTIIIGDPIKHFAEVSAYAFAHTEIRFDSNRATPRVLLSSPVMQELSEGRYLQFNFTMDGPHAPATVEIRYNVFFETNTLHRGLVRIENVGKVQVASLSPEHPSVRFDLRAPEQAAQFFSFVREGIWHIWTGYDHVLFLLALLLPSVLRRDENGWREVGNLRPALLSVVKIVTAFTIAHSITLSLATLNIVNAPTRLTESAIALSVALAAGNNLWPLVRDRGWWVAFGFGLIHGFGFATALSDLGLRSGSMAATLVGFNLGVELGQLAIVAAFLPLAFALRRTWLYRIPVFQFGSVCIVLVAATWCAERAFNLKFLPI